MKRLIGEGVSRLFTPLACRKCGGPVEPGTPHRYWRYEDAKLAWDEVEHLGCPGRAPGPAPGPALRKCPGCGRLARVPCPECARAGSARDAEIAAGVRAAESLREAVGRAVTPEERRRIDATGAPCPPREGGG